MRLKFSQRQFDFASAVNFPFEELDGFAFDSRVFIFQNFDKAKKLDKEKVLERLKLPMQDTVLIFLSQFSTNDPFLKKIKLLDFTVLHHGLEKPWQANKRLAKSLQDLAKDYKKQIQDPNYLLQKVSFQRDLAEQELLKLVHYVADRPFIQNEDIDALCPNDFSVNIFQLSDAIFEQNLATALKITDQIFKMDQNIFPLLALLRKQFQNSLKFLSCQSVDASNIQHYFPKLSPRSLEKNLNTARRYGYEASKKSLLRVNACDLQARNSKISPHKLFELMIIELCS